MYARAKSFCSLCLLTVGLLSITAPDDLRADIRKQTYTYKTVGTLPIQADVFQHDDAVSRPVVVWLHGGR